MVGAAFFESKLSYPSYLGEVYPLPPPSPQAIAAGVLEDWSYLSPLLASKSAQDGSKSAIIAPKMPVKRLSRAFSIDDAIWNPF